jgi:metal-sulfur cluster biosynthetic enzyme
MTETSSLDDEQLFDLEEAMRDVVDPELGINVVDLGLVYGLNVEQNEDGTVAVIDMTLTSAACPLTDVIEDQSRSALIGTGLVNDLRINWVWNPPWGPDKITDEGREQLRALGFTV